MNTKLMASRLHGVDALARLKVLSLFATVMWVNYRKKSCMKSPHC